MGATRRRGARPARETSRSTPALDHDTVMRAANQVDPALRQRSELLWVDRQQGSRGPKPGLTREEVIEAAMVIADRDGLGGVTMAAVASGVGFTPMALYRYFPSKEALLDAIVDAAYGLPPAPPAPEGHWRAEVAAWARAKRAMLCANPWLAELPFVAAPHGPNWLAWLEALARPFARTGIDPADIGQMISIIDGYTRGSSDTAVSLARARARGISEAQWAAAVGVDLGRAIGDPRFPAFASVITAPSCGKSRTFDESFEFGLDRVLDGIAAYVATVVAPVPSRATRKKR